MSTCTAHVHRETACMHALCSTEQHCAALCSTVRLLLVPPPFTDAVLGAVRRTNFDARGGAGSRQHAGSTGAEGTLRLGIS